MQYLLTNKYALLYSGCDRYSDTLAAGNPIHIKLYLGSSEKSPPLTKT